MRPQTATTTTTKSKLPASLIAEKAEAAVPRYRGTNTTK